MREFIDIVAEKYAPTTGSANEAALADLLAPAGKSAAIGPEKGEIKPNGISRLVSAYGSTRYVFSENGRTVSALQIMSRDSMHGIIANVYTVPEARRRHLAFALITRAKRDFDTIEHSSDLTNDGAAWASAVEEGCVERKQSSLFESTATLKDGRTVIVQDFEKYSGNLKQPYINVVATIDDVTVGSGLYDPEDEFFQSISVRKDYRRLGIASAIYDHVEAMGYHVKPSPKQEPDGKAFWADRHLSN